MLEYDTILTAQRDFFATGRTLTTVYRMDALRKLRSAIQSHEQEIADALMSDLGKSAFEAYATETGMILDEISFTLRHLQKWAKPKKVHAPIVHFPASCKIISEPYGVALILSPWNYPFQLTLAPLVGAIAGGNCAVVKPSAYSPATSAVIAKIIAACFDPAYVTVILGGREENKALLAQRFDYIFFTGSVAVGRQVMESASRNLTPVTLELGGKSPSIVCADADIDLAARRIIWGKTLNSGQTCVAPDYVLVHASVRKQLIECMKKYIREFFGDSPLQSAEYPKMINEKHYHRVKGYLGCGTIEAGGETDETTRRIAPTILTGAAWDTPVMQEEIFGPVLPVIDFDGIDQVIALVNARPKPLALYLFTDSRATAEQITGRVAFGGGCINDTIVHLASNYMPFGGVGASGMGGYHGKWSYHTFTHEKSILTKSNKLDIKLRYPPYKGKLGLLKKAMH